MKKLADGDARGSRSVVTVVGWRGAHVVVARPFQVNNKIPLRFVSHPNTITRRRVPRRRSTRRRVQAETLFYLHDGTVTNGLGWSLTGVIQLTTTMTRAPACTLADRSRRRRCGVSTPAKTSLSRENLMINIFRKPVYPAQQSVFQYTYFVRDAFVNNGGKNVLFLTRF